MSTSTGILGHERTVERLVGALDGDTLHHAYLFEGPRGVGKGTVARYLALRANCLADGARPCRACQSCRTILAGTHPDVMLLEPDPERASKTIPVDAVREVIRRTGYVRYGSRRRFVLVEPAEAMQPSAANALLKTLEEPPEGTGFILVCTNASALLPTILSRCQRVRFGAVEIDALTDWLEKRGHAGPDAARAARLSQGCPGRALDLLGGELEQRNTLRAELLSALAGDQKSRFDWAASLVKGGRQAWSPKVDLVLELLEDLLRDAAVVGAGAESPLLNADEPEVVRTWAKKLWPDGVRRLHDALEETRDNLAVMVSGRMTVDALLARVAAELE